MLTLLRTVGVAARSTILSVADAFSPAYLSARLPRCTGPAYSLPRDARGRGVTDEADPSMWSVGPILQASPHSSVLAYKKDTETLSVGSAYRVFLPARLLPHAQHVRTCMGVGDVVGRWLPCSQWREGLMFGGTERRWPTHARMVVHGQNGIGLIVWVFGLNLTKNRKPN
jgi:hypothetical protein